MKTCIKCNIPKSLGEFRKSSSNKNGLHSICASCKNAYSKARYEARQQIIFSLEGEFTCKKCEKTKPLDEFSRNVGTKTGKKYTCKECDAIQKRAYKYDITEEEYQALWNKQEGLCFGCHREPYNRGLFVDHCHPTFENYGVIKVRALLCNNCNSILGYARDNKETLSRLASLI